VDLVAMSFVRSAHDLAICRRHLAAGTRLIAKIEKPEAIENLDGIVAAADGLMVARGDLGVELPLEQVPGIQKRLVRQANLLAKPCIVATEMLESMIASPRPTRAEVSDVANAVLDGADAVMLSAETAVGHDPVTAVATMARIIEEAERAVPTRIRPQLEASVSPGIAAAAVEAARSVGAKVIVAYNRERVHRPPGGGVPSADADPRAHAERAGGASARARLGGGDPSRAPSPLDRRADVPGPARGTQTPARRSRRTHGDHRRGSAERAREHQPPDRADGVRRREGGLPARRTSC
jgi:hypothetical protein